MFWLSLISISILFCHSLTHLIGIYYSFSISYSFLYHLTSKCSASFLLNRILSSNTQIHIHSIYSPYSIFLSWYYFPFLIICWTILLIFYIHCFYISINNSSPLKENESHFLYFYIISSYSYFLFFIHTH